MTQSIFQDTLEPTEEISKSASEERNVPDVQEEIGHNDIVEHDSLFDDRQKVAEDVLMAIRDSEEMEYIENSLSFTHF